MDETRNPRTRRKRKRARDRYRERQQRRQAQLEGNRQPDEEHTFFRRHFPSYDHDKWLHRRLAWLFSSRSPVAKISTLVAVCIMVFFVGSYVLAERIFPNVYAFGIPMGELTVSEAEAAIQDYWDKDLSIVITVDGELLKVASPQQLGLSIDAEAMAIAAKAAGVAGLPFGLSIEPIIEVSHGSAQSTLLDLTESIYVPHYEAGYQWSGGRLNTVPGRRGRHMDITDSLDYLKEETVAIVNEKRFELRTIPLNPTVFDSSPFLDEAYVFLGNGIRLRAYDPFKDQILEFNVDEQLVAEWLTAGQNGLAVRVDTFHRFIENENVPLVRGGRYIDKLLATEKLQESLDNNNPDIVLRLNYLPQEYSVVRKDTGYRIGRKTGIPYDLIRDANPMVEWGALAVGDKVQIPSRDVMTPRDPVPHKRIIVDLEAQWLVAFEHGELWATWGISSGRETAPTYPGIFQILTHNESSFGGSYALCNEAGTNCSQWEMFWFMGIYEVVPGLMNGFHGAVELPNGGFLGGGGTWEPSTFGCIMSLNSDAHRLYDWAETGTMVEIISDEFAPESELGKYAQALIATLDTDYRPGR